MTLRLAAALSLLLGAMGLTGLLHLMGKGPFVAPAARHLREMKERTAVPDRPVDVDFADIAALPHGLPLADVAALERRAVRLEGYVHHILIAGDGDMHLEITNEAMTVDPLNATYVTGEITPQWRRAPSRWRYEPLVEVFRPEIGAVTGWDSGARRVRISGWLMYDFQYDDPHGPWHPRLSGWEIHPVTRIECWDDSLRAFVEFRR